jgi:hypothetical protein
LAGRPKNSISSEKVTFSASDEVVHYLEDLIKVGLYGKTSPEVVNTLVTRQIEQLIKDGIIKQHEFQR